MSGYLTVLGGICINLFNGNQYLWGNIANYVVSYYHYLGDSSSTNKMGVIVLPISMIVSTIFYSLGSFMMKKFDIKNIMILSVILMLGSILLTSYI